MIGVCAYEILYTLTKVPNYVFEKLQTPTCRHLLKASIMVNLTASELSIIGRDLFGY